MLKVYNTLGRELQEFKPLRPGFVGIYVCGPTVYGHSHIGHAKSYVSFDVIVRYLRHLGHRVRYVQNITDVGHLTDNADAGEDKIGAKARELGLEPMEVAEEFTRSYFEDMDKLNVRRPDISPRASGHVPEQIELVQRLIERGHAYEADGNVYFDVESFAGYGKLSGRNLDEMMEAVRIEARTEKRHPADFAVWIKAEPGHLMRWNSPWGEGFPGWHLECSAMSMKYLGETVDIHGGGIENSFPHHEDEIAQSEAATGKPFVRYWLHNNMVTVNGQKMGKSLGNFITLKDAFAGEPPLGKPVRPMVLRYFVLTSHYRSPLDFSVEALDAAEKGLERIENTVGRVRRALRQTAAQMPDSEAAVRERPAQPLLFDEPLSAHPAGSQAAVPDQVRKLITDTRAQFLAEMDNDFNTAGAIGVLSTFTRDVNRLLDEDKALPAQAFVALNGLYEDLGGRVLGIVRIHTDAIQASADGAIQEQVTGEATGTVQVTAAGGGILRRGASIDRQLIETLLAVRADLRKARQYELADSIRERLAKLGIEVQDGADGARWQFK
jgi:cysteinyl-tRNA synthetase